MEKNKSTITCQIWVSVLIMLPLLISNGFATLREPEIFIYGQVYNHYQNNKIMLTDANIQMTIRKKGNNASRFYEGAVECLKCNEYDPTGFNCLSCEKYAYSIKIPQETPPVAENNDAILPIFDHNQQYDVLEARVNGELASIQIKSQMGNVLPDDKQGKFILAGQARRSHYYEIDLELVLPVEDTDNDGLPDFWEKQYGLDINDASDVSNDTDKDGWDNLTEFLNATNPLMSNNIPKLLDKDILAFEGSSSLFQLNIADSDTSPEDLMIKFINIPDTICIIFHGANTPFKQGHIFQSDDIIPWIHLKNGNLVFHYKGTCTDKINRLYVELIDDTHAPVLETVTINTFKPTTTDATDALLWTDAFYHAQRTSGEQSKQLLDRSGNDNRGHYYNVSDNKNMIEAVINMSENSAISSNPVINIDGFFELPYATPLFPQNNMTVITVFKVNSSENDQIIGTGHYLEISVVGSKHPLHPGELRVADETNTIYSHRKVANEWIMATITKRNGQLYIDINGLWTGGPFSYDEEHILPGDPSLGGKNIWTWDFNHLKWVSNISGLMKGQFAEMLVYDRPLLYLEKWRIYAHLQGKWFGAVIADYSTAPKGVQIMAVTGRLGESIRKHKAAADLAWIDYSDAVFSDNKVMEALACLESYLPDNWQWRNIPPSVDEASQALDAINFDYQNEFVSIYGKDTDYILIGGMGNDTLIGGYENDILVGGDGADTLKGSNGKDIFVVSDKDVIVDFNVSDHDILDISHLLTNTDAPLKDYIHFEIVNDLETGESHTQLQINADGAGNTFDDATILLRNVVLREQIDITRLWASGNLHTGGSRPTLELSLFISDETATENPEEPAGFEISFSENMLPENLTVPVSLEGTAKLGQDYLLSIPVWNDLSKTYESTVISHNIIPVKLKKGDQKLTINILPIPDKISESDENISISLSKKEDYYLLAKNDLSTIVLSDGIDEISIQTQNDLAVEGKPAGGSVIITRMGSIDISKEVHLLVKGTAENGRDFFYIPSEISIAPGETKAIIDIVAYQDKEIEDTEFVELIVSPGDYKLRGISSVRVAIRDQHAEILQGDMDQNNEINLKDAIVALMVCAGKDVSAIMIESSIDKEGIAIKDVLYILDEISTR
jgi:hypothetical protein